MMFNAKLSQLIGRELRLPTEAEWEYACRAGTTTDYHTGDGETALKRAGWYERNSWSQTNDIAKLSANAWGLYDCHGNVWEWCADWYSDTAYYRGDCVDPTGCYDSSNPVIRGGSWVNAAVNSRSSARRSENATSRYGNIGFRVAASPVGTEQ